MTVLRPRLGRSSWSVLGAAAILIVALMSIFAIELGDSQVKAHRDVERRFTERATVSAALIQALFESSDRTTRANNARRYGTPRVTERVMARAARQQHLAALVLLRHDGRLVAASPNTSPDVLRAVRASTAGIQRALATQPFAVSDVLELPGGKRMIQFAQRLETRAGRRVLVSGFDPELVYRLLGGYLARVPNAAQGRAYVLDGKGAVIASPARSMRAGTLVREPQLLEALAGGDHGAFAGGRYFAARRVGKTPWRVVLTAPKSRLFAPVSGTRKWVPWILFLAFAIVAALAAWLLQRVLRSADDLASVNDELARTNHALETRVGELHQSKERLRHDALHDGLTGLPNRVLFLDRLTHSLARAARHRLHRCAVLFLDLDRFKLVNDSFSHAIGDELLVTLAGRLSASIRPTDTVARLSGDEFTILLDDLESADEAAAVARRALAAIEQPVRIGGRELFVTASAGIALSEQGVDAPELMRNADIAMYDAKRRGKARWAVFNADMHSRVVSQLHVETELRSAIDERRLRVFYQPIVDLRTGELVGLEALARWPAGRPAIPPDVFIPVAEETGLIASLGRLVLAETCGRVSEWRRRNIIDTSVTASVNISRWQLVEPGLLADVTSVLQDSGLPAEALRLEITESTMITEPRRMRAALEELERLGVRTHIDDFGTGHSSLAVLQHFPGDTLKIDRSFIATMDEDEGSEAIVRATIALAKNLNLHTTAEGVESRPQLEKLAALGCDFAQGYLFSKPRDAAEIEKLIQGWRAVPTEQVTVTP